MPQAARMAGYQRASRRFASVIPAPLKLVVC